MKLILEYAEPLRFKAYERNARVHTAAQIAQIREAITSFGFTNPLLVDEDDVIIAGHGRQIAAIDLGLALVPFIVLRGLTDLQKRALRIADNKLALNASWDEELLRIELSELHDIAELTGFSAEEREALVSPGETDPDDAPEPPAPESIVTRLGDLWVCGHHRLLCGDATIEDDVERLLDGVQPHLMVTDPPYGVDYDADWRNRTVMAKGERVGQHGSRAVGEVENDDRADWREAWALFPGIVAYVWHGGLHASVVAESLKAEGFGMAAQIVWAKNHMVISRGHYHWKHEPCWYAVRGEPGFHYWYGSESETTVWLIDKPFKSETGHSTQKPVECMRRPMVNSSAIGQAVYDPFLGSGTTMIAAEIEGRSCYGMEISPAYVDVAVKRWQAFTGKGAVLERDGRCFDEIELARLPRKPDGPFGVAPLPPDERPPAPDPGPAPTPPRGGSGVPPIIPPNIPEAAS